MEICTEEESSALPISNNLIERLIGEHKLNHKQSKTFKLVSDAFLSDKTIRCAILGEGGTGKTRIITTTQSFSKQLITNIL
jgi:hypothetical protein